MIRSIKNATNGIFKTMVISIGTLGGVNSKVVFFESDKSMNNSFICYCFSDKYVFIEKYCIFLKRTSYLDDMT